MSKTARVHCKPWRRGGLAGCGMGAAVGYASDRASKWSLL
jgi:hypothetical protein